MNVYDWDKTIYPKDSTAEFYVYNIRKDLTLLRFFPKQLIGWILWGLKIIDKTEMKKYFYSYLKGVKNIDENWRPFGMKELAISTVGIEIYRKRMI